MDLDSSEQEGNKYHISELSFDKTEFILHMKTKCTITSAEQDKEERVEIQVPCLRIFISDLKTIISITIPDAKESNKQIQKMKLQSEWELKNQKKNQNAGPAPDMDDMVSSYSSF